MDMLQFHLDEESSHRDPYLRKTCIRCLLHLNKRHGTLPTSMRLSKVAKDGSHPVSGGGFADIWKGRLEDTQTAVCLKVLRVFTATYNEKKLLKQLSNEVLLWRQLKHPNILQFLGITEELFWPSYCIVSPSMANGDIVTYSLVHGSTLDEKIKMMSEISEGIRYLHEHHPPIVHSDIKGLNILVSDDGECCLADFGLVTLENESSEGQVHVSTSQAVIRGSVPWLAPELMNPDYIGVPSRTTRDIYALGCTIFELLTGNAPFVEKKMDILVMIEVLKGSRPGQPSDCPDWLWAVVESCWREELELRPTAAEVASQFVWMSRQREPSPVRLPCPSGDVSVPTEMSGDSEPYGPTGRSGTGDYVYTCSVPNTEHTETIPTSTRIFREDALEMQVIQTECSFVVKPAFDDQPGSPQLKKGCLTCRIRRKKRDYRRQGESSSSCRTCVRLRLPCYWPLTRPQWLWSPLRITRLKDSVKETLSRRRNGLFRGLPWRLFSKRLRHQGGYATVGTIGEVESFDSSSLGDNDPYPRDPQLQGAYEREDMWDDVSLQDAWKNFRARVFSLSM
ncbi:hypothetical protein E1B28_012720 [Marasmius oreades]|nr:uncharacterized protein E1B28_012720 [Marasmius oreades]KAG7088755.1 hypothetical protein E1B28_012720 [Marasmius oreades]